MNKFLFAAAILLCAGMIIVGCSPENGQTAAPSVVSKVIKAVTPAPDPMSASEMVKKYPELQKICDLAGGCQNVKITCTKYDGTGNSNLRNETVWDVVALGTTGTGFSSHGGFKEALGEEYPGWFGARKLEQEMRDEEKEKPTVYPNHTPCDPATCK